MERDLEQLSNIVVQKVKKRILSLKESSQFKVPSISRLGKLLKESNQISKESHCFIDEKPKFSRSYYRNQTRRNNSDVVTLEPLPQNSFDLPMIELETADTSVANCQQPDESMDISILNAYNKVSREDSRENRKLNKTFVCRGLDISIEGIHSQTHIRANKRPLFIPNVVENVRKKIEKKERPKKSTKMLRKIETTKAIDKESLLKNWINMIQMSNGLNIENKAGSFRYFIGKGNNSHLVNHIMKTR